MVYLNTFEFAQSEKHAYPHRFLESKGIGKLYFNPITIFYGSNGSGKSTALNVIARAIGVQKMSLGNENEFFKSYLKECSYEIVAKPKDISFIRSEDIMEGIAAIRRRNEEIFETVQKKSESLDEYGIDDLSQRLTDPDSGNYKDRYMLSRIKSAQILSSDLYSRQEYYSNGETAMTYFNTRLMSNSLFFLDEPENSMDAPYQHKLAVMLESLSHKSDCQFIIATHSPFLLSIENALIIDLDSFPVRDCKWYQLSNMRYYYRFFNLFSSLFEYEENSH